LFTVLGIGAVHAAPVLSIDFGHNPPGTPVQAGFTGIAGATSEPSHTEAVGAYTVKVEGDGFYQAGFNAGNVASAVAPLLEDYYYSNSTDPAVGVKVTVTGVMPNVPYAVTVWSYDEDNIFSVTPTLWGPASGSSTIGTSGLVADSGGTPYPTTLGEKSATFVLTSSTNELAFFGSSTGGSGGTRLNGFQLATVPEPTTGLLAVGAIAAGLTIVRRRSSSK
jgi:hypothetical protein